MKLYLYPYKLGSKGGKKLAKSLKMWRLMPPPRTKFLHRRNRLVINWGNSEPHPNVNQELMLNKFAVVERIANKLNFFEDMPNEILPSWTTNKEEAIGWCDEAADGPKVVCRTMLRAHSGRGIVLAKTEDEVVNAPLYVAYIKKQEEYRVHIGRKANQGYTVIDTQRKGRNREIPDEQVNWQIRNHQNGFIYMREGVVIPDAVQEVAVECMRNTMLDFGAVDVIYQPKSGRAYVLEINTAPGIEGTTLEKYEEYFNGWR